MRRARDARVRITSRNTHHSGLADPIAPAGNLRREDDAPLGRRLGAAARRFVARRRRQQQDVAGARRRASTTTARCPGGRAGAAAPARARLPRCRAASRACCRRPSRTCRRRRRRWRRWPRWRSSPAARAARSPTRSAQRARVSAGTAGHAADFGAALHARVAANRHEAAAGPRRQAEREAEVDQRLHGVDAVRVLRQAHRPDEDGLRPRQEQPRERLDVGAARRRSRARCASQVVPRHRRSASARTAGVRVDERRDRRRRRRARLQHADEEGEVAAGVHVEPVVGEPRAGRSRCGRSTGSSSARGPARDTG